MPKQYLIFFLLVISCTFITIYGQEQVVPLIDNPHLSRQEKIQTKTLKSGSEDNKYLVLPFFDDFSYTGPYPDQSKWEDKHVYVNHTLAADPPTIGLATFDCLDKNGNFHLYAGSVSFRSDSLTSKKIDMARLQKKRVAGDKLYFCDSEIPVSDSLYYKDDDNNYFPLTTPDYLYDISQTLYTKNDYLVFTDTLCVYDKRGDSLNKFPPYNYYDVSAADSIILSFFCQPEGLTDDLDPEDSLLIEFFDPIDSVWNNVYALPGLEEVKWHYIAIPVVEENYFNPGFQFRIVNKARISGEQSIPGKIGNFDHWHLDYIYLDHSRKNSFQTINDAAFASNPGTIIKTLRSLPWLHFRNTTAYNTLRQNSFPFSLRNLSDFTMWFYNIQIETNLYPEGTQVHLDVLGDFELNFSDTLIKFNEAYNYLLDEPPAYDSLAFFIKAHFNPSFDNTINKDINSVNDTISFVQKFYNYYAYDDGSAESGYGVPCPIPLETRIANRFQIYRTDSLRGIDILFNSSLYADELDNQPFKIAVWEDNNGPSKQFYIMEYDASGNRLYPGKRGSLEFKRYRFSKAVYMPAGTYYFGIIQNDGEFINMGLDKNTNQSAKIYYFYNNNWYNSKVNGSLMIRPLFGAPLPVNNPVNKQDKKDLRIYPNPAQDYLNIHLSSFSGMFSYQIISIQGKVILSGDSYSTSLDISNLPAGVYLIRIIEKNQHYTSKFIKSH